MNGNRRFIGGKTRQQMIGDRNSEENEYKIFTN